MTISSTTNKVQYTGDGVQTDFPFAFRILEDTDLEVYVDDDLKILNTDYTIDGGAEEGTGTVKFNTAPADQSLVTLVRNVPSTQEVDYVDYDRFAAETHEGALDKLTMLVQEVEETLSRTLQYSATSPETDPFFVNFPEDANDRAGKIWAFDSAGNLVILIDTAEEKAYRWAETEEDVVVENRDGRDRYSAYHWSRKAANQVETPLENKGELYGHNGTDPTAVVAPTADGQVLVSDAAEAAGLKYAALTNTLPPTTVADKLNIAQVNVTGDGWELTQQFADVLIHAKDMVEDDESVGNIKTAVSVSHYNNVAMQFVNPGANAYQAWINGAVIRRHDALNWQLRCRVAKGVGDANVSGVAVFEAQAFLYSGTPGSLVDLNPTGLTTITANATIDAIDANASEVTFAGLIPLDGGASVADQMVSIRIQRKDSGGADTFLGPVDLILAVLEIA